jgi:hypothetical protein
MNNHVLSSVYMCMDCATEGLRLIMEIEVYENNLSYNMLTSL